ncbi:hypothetical protein ASD44_06000 [Mesorhizobium sp. Root554]|nr:hypothetical protein ASD27_06005 [Mesorhizobium sp. Root1471]KQZ36186.1 hypothetical protein ASD44_06000 [Mesorhizobium sp. Root554]
MITGERDTLGVLTFRESDQPWWICDFEPVPAFERYRHFFEAETVPIGDDDSALLASHDEWLISMKFRLRSRIDAGLPNAAEMGIVDIDMSTSTAFFRPTDEYCQARSKEGFDASAHL